MPPAEHDRRRANSPSVHFPPSVATRTVIETKLAELTRQIDALSARKSADPALVADVAIYQKAAQFILRYPEEFFTAVYMPETIRALDAGIARAKELEAGTAPWAKKAGTWCAATRHASMAACSRMV